MGCWSNKFFNVCKPRSRLTGSEWADRYRYVAPGTSPEPGEWRTDRVPYLREPMDSTTDRLTEFVVMMTSSQIGKSEFLLNSIGYYADQEPAPQLMLQPTVEMAESFSKERIDPTFRYSEGLKNKLDIEGKDGRGSSRKSSTTIRMKHYQGGYLALVGANSPAGLASRPIRVLLCDEVDRYGFTKEGDPLKLAIQRTTNFHNRKICMVSTPTIKGASKIEEWFLRSDQRYFYVPCPHCGHEHVLKWGNVRWHKDENGNSLPETAHMVCPNCDEVTRGAGKPPHDMLKAGRWIATKPEITRIKGYHISSLYSPWVSLSSLVTEFLEATKTRDKKGLMEFINLKLGETWEESDDDLTAEHLHKRREYYDAELPDGVLLLTAGIDVQHDRLECNVIGWGLGRESWGIEYNVFMGNPSTSSVWQQLDAYLQKQFYFADGSTLGISGACIDSGDGHYMTDVYEFTKPRESRRIFAIKGRGGVGIPFINKPKRDGRTGAALFGIGVDAGKSTIMARLKIEDEGPGYCHWPRQIERGYDEEFFKGLVSEKLIFKYVNGQTKQEWKKVYERNEPLDTTNYATAAMEILNPNFEWLAEHKDKGNVYQQTSQKKGRRVISKGVSI